MPPPVLSWEPIALPDLPGVQLNDIARGRNGWVAIGGAIPDSVGTAGDTRGAVLFSADGAEWQRVEDGDLLGAGFAAVAAAADGGFVAAGSAHNVAATWHSPDGVSWSLGRPAIDFGQAGLLDVTAVADGFVAVGLVEREGVQLPAAWHSPDGEGWVSSGPIGNEPGFFRTILATDEGMLAGGSAQSDAVSLATARLWSSSDGRSWTPLALGDPTASGWVAGLRRVSSTFLAVGSVVDPVSAAAVWLSSDGGAWTQVADDRALEPVGGLSSEEMEDVAGVGDWLLAVGGPACCSAPPSAWLSVDGSRWVRVGLGDAPGHLSAVLADGAGALVVGYREQAAAMWRVEVAEQASTP